MDLSHRLKLSLYSEKSMPLDTGKLLECSPENTFQITPQNVSKLSKLLRCDALKIYN